MHLLHGLMGFYWILLMLYKRFPLVNTNINWIILRIGIKLYFLKNIRQVFMIGFEKITFLIEHHHTGKDFEMKAVIRKADIESRGIEVCDNNEIGKCFCYK